MNNSWDEERRNYRGGQNRPIWIVDLKTLRPGLAAVDRFEGRRSGVGRRHGVLHLRSRRRRQRVVVRHADARSSTQVTKFTDFDVKSLDAGAGARGVRAGRLHPRARSEDRQEPSQSTITRDRRLPVDDAALGGRDQPDDEHRPVADRQARRWSKRAARSSRSRPRRATSATSRNSSGSAEREPAWSPDGKWISYFSDKSGEYKLVIESQDGLGAAARDRASRSRRTTTRRSWSPDSKKLLYTDTNLNVWVMDVASGQAKIVGSDPWMVPQRTLNPSWSPDSKWVAYRVAPATRSIARSSSPTSRPARRSRSPTAWPTRCGRRGTRAASICGSSRRPTSASASQWLDMTSYDRDETFGAVPRGAEEGRAEPAAAGERRRYRASAAAAAAADGGRGGATAARRRPTRRARAPRAPVTVQIDFDGLQQRILSVPGVPARQYSQLKAGVAGHGVLPRRRRSGRRGARGNTLHRYPLERSPRRSRSVDGVAEYAVSADGQKLVYRTGGGAGGRTAPAARRRRGPRCSSSTPTRACRRPAQGRLDVTLRMYLEPKAEFKQIFNEGWRNSARLPLRAEHARRRTGRR